MISAFQSREFGSGLDLTKEQLKEVNKLCKGKKCHDVKVAIEVETNPEGYKPELTKSPFVKEFEYGTSNDGYWTYQHMVLQLEDCINILKHLFVVH